MSNDSSTYLVLARKYRPKTFSQVVGQDHVIQTLRNSIKTGRIAHAYLLVGPRGIGKTTTARLLASALNAPGAPSVEPDPAHPDIIAILEGRSLDVREIDGASNNGVEQVRELREDVRYPPQSGRYKIYIIDEVHMLSTAAFNALLKTLEEPPSYVKFIFATTEVQKVPATIMSRCQRFDLRRIPTELITRHLSRITEAEGIKAEPAALNIIARLADGGMRDAQSLLDQMISFCGETIKESDVLEVMGVPPRNAVVEILSNTLKGQTKEALHCLTNLEAQGKDTSRIMADLVTVARELLIAQQAPEILATELPPEELTSLESLKSLLKPAKLIRLVELLTAAENRLRFTLQPKIWLEMTIISASQITQEIDLNDVLATLKNKGISPLEPQKLPFAPDTSANPKAEMKYNVSGTSHKEDFQVKKTIRDSSNELHTTINPKSDPDSGNFKSVSESSFSERNSSVLDEAAHHQSSNKTTGSNHHKAESPGCEMLAGNTSQFNEKKQPYRLAQKEIEEFKNDPEIKEALQRFGARLVDIKKRTDSEQIPS